MTHSKPDPASAQFSVLEDVEKAHCLKSIRHYQLSFDDSFNQKVKMLVLQSALLLHAYIYTSALAKL
jgi:hypothetical protein